MVSAVQYGSPTCGKPSKLRWATVNPATHERGMRETSSPYPAATPPSHGQSARRKAKECMILRPPGFIALPRCQSS